MSIPAAIRVKASDISAAPADEYVPVVKGTAFASGACRGLLVGTAGAANLVQPNGTARTNVPLQAGYNPISCREVSAGGTADDIWALY